MTDFSWVNWTAEDIAREAEQAIAAKKEALEVVKAISADQRTFTNTIIGIEQASEKIADTEQIIQLLMSVHPYASFRDAAQAVSDTIAEANTALDYDKGLYDALQAWLQNGSDVSRLTGADKKLTDDMVITANRMGFGLPIDKFDELKRISTELKKLESLFEKTINEWSDGIEVTKAQLAGLPERYIEGLTRTANGNYFISLKYPDLFPFLRQAEDDSARKELATKSYRKGGQDNMHRLAEMIRLRQRSAELLGYKTHADFVAEVRMAKTAESAKAFITDIIEKLTLASRTELRDLIKYKKEVLGLEHPKPIGFHEFSYWSHKLKESRYGIDTEKIKEYFPLEQVMKGMLEIYQDLLGLQFKKLDTSLWHPDTQLYEVTNSTSNDLIGHFALDLYPRDGKYSHAGAFPVTKHMIALVCNFPKATPTNPSLVAYDDIETLFHEFGHVMHGLVSGAMVKHSSQTGFAVANDFVEAPSQMLEEWPWDDRVIDRISMHYRTNEPMPQEMREKLRAARHHMDANYYLAQAVLALYDLMMHGQPVTAPVDPAHLAQMHRDLELEHLAMDIPDDAIRAAGWDHMGDYDAGYYGYLWSKVYALDMFSIFSGNPFDATIGRRYRTHILEPGASEKELELVKKFLGREPSNAAFLAALGIS